MLLLLVIVLLGISALLAASETALFALARAQHTRASLGEAAAQAVDSLLRRPLESLVLIIGIEAVQRFVQVVGSSTVNSYRSVPWSIREIRSMRCRFVLAPLNPPFFEKFVVSTMSVSPSQCPTESPVR